MTVFALRVVAALFKLIPFTLLYTFSRVLVWVLHRVFSYRLAVVQANLERCFPQHTKEEKQRITKAFYLHLSHQLVEGLKGFTLGKEEAIARCKVMNPEVLEDYYKKKQDVIMVFGHTHNWEWPSLAGNAQIPHRLMAVYKAVKNRGINDWIKENRERFGATLVAMQQVPRFYIQEKEDAYAAAFLADQNPANPRHAHWVSFFGQKTAFLSGPAKLAKKFSIPLLYLSIEKRKNGYYEIIMEPLVEQPKDVEEVEITQRFAKRLQQAIEEQPEAWLWSHKRFKHTFKSEYL